jgi:hypothetical protein
MFASDPQGALATAAAGLALGQEFANIENNKQKRELEKARIEFLKKKNDFELKELDYTAANLPTVMGAKLVEAQALAAAQRNNLALQTAMAEGNVPALQAGAAQNAAQAQVVGGQVLLNEAAKTPAQKAQEQAQAAAYGQRMGNLMFSPAGAGPLANATVFEGAPSPEQVKNIREAEMARAQGLTPGEIQGTDKEGNTTKQRVLLNSVGEVVKPLADPVITHFGPAKNIAVEAQKRVPAVKTLLAQADEIEQLIIDYEKKVPDRIDRFGRAGSTRMASVDDSNIFKIGVKSLGQWLQDPETVKITAKIAAFKNQLTKEQSGGTVTAQEFANLDPEIPSYWDLVDPQRARSKLAAFREKANSVIQTAGQFSEASKTGAPVAQPVAAPAAAASGLPTTQQLGKIKAAPGTVQQTADGQTWRVDIIGGRPSWVRVK